MSNKSEIKYVDIHTHAYPEKIAAKAVAFVGTHYEFGEIPNGGTMDALEANARAGGHAHVVVFGTATRPDQVYNVNTWMGGAVADKRCFTGFGTIHRDYDKFEEEIDRIISLGLKGIKLHADFQGFNIDDPKMYPIYEAIGERLPVMMHVGDEKLDYAHPRRVANVIRDFPKMTVIAAHMGGYSRWKEANEYLVGKNVFFDTSSTLFKMDFDEAADMMRRHGIEKIMFGTDYPIITQKEELEKIMSSRRKD